MFRRALARTLLLAVVVAGIATGGALAAADNSITVGPATAITKSGYRFSIPVTCTPSTTAARCDGQLSIMTVPIKPYSSIAKKAWVVGALPFSIPAGTTKPVRGRLLAGALVQAKLTGRVKVIVKIVREEVVVGAKPMTLKLGAR